MKQILVYGNRKTDAVVFDISTPELREKGFLALFKELNEDWKVYDYVLTKPQLDLYEKALTGDGKAAKQLLTLRKTYEYEEWTIETVR